MDAWNDLPKFLLLENAMEEWIGVMHCHHPRFIMQFTKSEDDIEEEGRIAVWIDEFSDFDVPESANLMREAADFYAASTSDWGDEGYSG